MRAARKYLEAFVLQDSFDCSIFAAGRELGLEDDPKGAVSNNFALSVGEIPCFSRNAVLYPFADDFCRQRVSVHGCGRQRDGYRNVPPIRKLVKFGWRFCVMVLWVEMQRSPMVDQMLSSVKQWNGSEARGWREGGGVGA
jgi:hypothetical protein